jgi:type I restriction enzyme S subunit
MSKSTKTVIPAKAGIQKTNGLVPRLRFPEFRDAGEWEPSTLGKLFVNRQETGFESLPLLSLTDKEGIIPQEESNRKNNASADRSRYLRVVPGDIAYNTMRMWEGRSAYVDREGVISPAYTVCEPVGSANGLFFSYYFKTAQLIEQFRRYSQGLVKDTLNLKYTAFSKIPVLFPSPEEQQKIADCLSSLDALIAAQADKIDALKTHKKGLMQQLFPREGENVPRLRFPEFRDAGEWEEGKLGDKNISTFVKERMPLEELTLESYVSTENLLPDYAGVTTSSKLPSTGSFTRYKKGDILISNIRPYLKKVWSANKDGATSNDVIVIRAKSKVRASFLTFLLKNDEFINYVMKGAKGVKMPRGDISLMKEYPVAIPANPKEQQKIADCLSSLDALIAAHAEKLDALKTHKKGLMQQLFPSPEAV